MKPSKYKHFVDWYLKQFLNKQKIAIISQYKGEADEQRTFLQTHLKELRNERRQKNSVRNRR